MEFNSVFRESYCTIVVICQIFQMFLFVHFKPAFSFANITLITVIAIIL